MKKAYSTQIKTIIKGDYYQIGQKGAYHRHRDVSVKCCENQQDYKQQQPKKLVHQMQIQNSNISINQNSESSIQTPKYQHRKNSQFGSRSPFLQDCIKILQKEEVNSIHEQDSQQIKNKNNIVNQKNLINIQKRDKNSKMRRSSQNQTSPKKGILKRSMNDKKQEEIRSSYRNHGQQNNYITDRPVRMQYIQNMNPKQRERLQLLQQQQLAAQRYKSAQSIDNQSLRSRQYIYHNNIQKSLRQINQNPGPYTQTARIFNQVHSGRVNFPNSHRVHTEGKETVVVNNRYNNRHQNGFGDDSSNNYDHLTYNVYQSINFLNQRFKYLENQLINKEKKLKVVQLQRTLKMKSQQMNRLKKQNQELKKRRQHVHEIKTQQKQVRRYNHSHNQECNKKSTKINYESLGLQKLQPWIQLAEEKATFIISFLVVLVICIMLGKSGSTCSK